jgi:two-component system CheB/CheR fusion protein
MAPSATEIGSPDERLRPTLVSIGASAGGVLALQDLFEALPNQTGAAFVVVVHLDPEHASDLSRIIASRTSMRVVEAVGEQPIEPDTIYVIPPNRRLLVSADQISSAAFNEPRGQRAPIDQFFRSVADQHGDGFAVILTGGGSDGTVGVKAIKEAGGVILVQDPNEAEYPSMPQSAIAVGVADFVLPVKDIARRLVELINNKQQLALEDLASKDEETLRRILLHLRQKTGQDFSQYKRATVGRRVARRMQVTHNNALPQYLSHLQAHPGEVQALLADLLISVTSFFRDPEAFEELAEKAIQPLLDRHQPEAALRVWVPGCATGEEVYSIAMLLIEQTERRQERPEFQIFASDLDLTALAAAREGLYPLAIRADVSEARLRRFFTREGEHYRIRREVRDLVVFAHHSLLRDPPFSHIDLLSCRNLLIYLDRALQSQVRDTFHYALRPAGYLFLGSSESIEAQGLFRVISRDARIYQSVASQRALLPVPSLSYRPRIPELPVTLGPSREARVNHGGDHRQALEQLAVPSILVDNTHRILNLSETAGRFLLQPGGPPTHIADDLVRPELRLDLQAGFHRAFEQNEATMTMPLAVQFNGTPRQVSLYITPVTRDSTRSALVLFLEGGPSSPPEQPANDQSEGASSHVIAQLRNELATSQGHLRTVRAQYEAVTEELRASNEELQSINEEYRSTAEELETSKEELQSINEELHTLNNELKLKLEAVSRAHNDLQNLMSATDVAMLFLTPALRINRFTPSLSSIFNVTPGDEGRPISNFTHRLDYDALIDDANRVLANLTPVERVVRGLDGSWFLMRIRPYRTLDERIEGVVATFVDVTEQREAEKNWEARQRLLIGELSHRVRNTLSVVQAVVGQTLRARQADPELHKVVIERLQSIAKTHEMIVRGDWSGAELGAIIREQLGPYLGEGATRIQIEGPPVILPSEIATSVGLLVNELATNATKYGALSQSDGKIRLGWELVDDGRGVRVKFAWREEGGPRISAPGPAGFGTSLINGGFPTASIHREFKPEGLVCTIDFPINAPRQRPRPDPD